VPISYTVDREQRRLTARAEGHVGLADIEAYVKARDEDSALGYDEFFDARGATTRLTPDEVQSLVDHCRELIKNTRLGRTGVVADDEQLLRLVGMFSTLVLPLGMTVQVFRELEPAEEWLDIEAADGSDVSFQSDLSVASSPAWTCPHCGHGEGLRMRQCPKCGRFENEPRVTRPPR
jgi:hypothetical protein